MGRCCLVVAIHGSVPFAPPFCTAACCWHFSWRPVPKPKPRVVWLRSRSSYRDCIVSILYSYVWLRSVGCRSPGIPKVFNTPWWWVQFCLGHERQHADYGCTDVISLFYHSLTPIYNNTPKYVPVDYYYYYYRKIWTLIIIIVGSIHLYVNLVFFAWGWKT